jgi:eukaryotic translation initiation factor 2C
VVTHRGQIRRKYRITKLTMTPVNRTVFQFGEAPNQREDTVAHYFQSKYNINLYFPHLPCLVVGDPAKAVYLPMEVCEIVQGQRHLRKLNERQVKINLGMVVFFPSISNVFLTPNLL